MDEIFSLGQWIKRRRKARDLTQEALAQRAGCSKELIAKIEADARRPSRQLAERLADQLGLAADERATFLQAARAEIGVDRLAPPVLSVSLPSLAPERALPRGTITFLFTDIEGSTQLWERHPQQMSAAITRHEAILRAAITTAGGVVFKTVGDAVYAAFASALDAVIAAVAGQRALQAEAWTLSNPLRLRMALHSGVAEVRGADYVGLPLSRVARLLAAGHGGQILLSRATVELVREQLPPGLELRDLGAHRLKDLSLPEQVFQLVAPDLPAGFPPLQTLTQHRANLPAQPTPLIGREREIAEVGALLRRADVRLLTLTGPGGTGKTRLAIEAGAELLDAFADGVWFVNLAPIRDPDLLATTITQALDVPQAGGRPLLDSLKGYLREKRLLLILDNFEQLLDASLVVAELLAAAPGLSALVTSRSVLRLSGEHEYTVPPLALPPLSELGVGGRGSGVGGRGWEVVRASPGFRPPTSDPWPLAVDPQFLTQYEAVRLFIERAQAARPGFAVTSANAPAVAEICHRLDGLPLAIGLAAARVKLFPPEVLLARLERRLPLLTGGPRDLPARQQTLRNTIDWSYHLLSPDEQALFWRLGVFVGGCTLEAAEAVCRDQGSGIRDQGSDATSLTPDPQPLTPLLEGVAALVDQNLLKQMEGPDGEPRFTMLETIREYALERLDASGEAEALRRRHAISYLELAETAAPGLIGREQRAWLARLDAEQDNLRAALAWMLERNEVEAGLRLGGALHWFWIIRGGASEGRRWLQALLARADQAQVSGLVLANAQFAAGDLASLQDETAVAIPLLESSLRLYQSAGDRGGMARVLHILGISVSRQGEGARGVALIDESLALYQELGDVRGTAEVLLSRSQATSYGEGDYARGTAMVEESVRLFREVGDPWGISFALAALGWSLHDQGDIKRGAELVEEALELARDLGDRQSIMGDLFYLAVITYRGGDLERARLLLEELLVLARQLGSSISMSNAFIHLGVIARYAGNLALAQQLLEEGVRLTPQPAAPFRVALYRRYQADVLYDQGDVEAAARLYRESLPVFDRLGIKWDCASCLEALASVLEAQGQAVRAVRLWGSAAATREAIGAPLPPIDRPRRDEALARLRAELGGPTFEAAWNEGWALPLEQAIAEALIYNLQ